MLSSFQQVRLHSVYQLLQNLGLLSLQDLLYRKLASMKKKYIIRVITPKILSSKQVAQMPASAISYKGYLQQRQY